MPYMHIIGILAYWHVVQIDFLSPPAGWVLQFVSRRTIPTHCGNLRPSLSQNKFRWSRSDPSHGSESSTKMDGFILPFGKLTP